ncbi:S8 family peptidase [Microbulbifer discodermiae]|uniref:S8 family peptidase n=1 Tax=Microbulbifer sp. 2201CG32-9 TaxID=3232309 RepID=UPI00345C24EC
MTIDILFRKNLRQIISILIAIFFTSVSIASNATEAINNRIIIKFKDTQAMVSADSTVKATELTVSQMAGNDLKYLRSLAIGAQLYQLSSGQDESEITATLDRLNQDPSVEYAEMDRRMYHMSMPNDPRYSEQWHYFESIAGINLHAAWDVTQGEGSVVAVIDTGFTDHSDLTSNMLLGYDMISDPDTAQDGDGRDNDAHDNGDWQPPLTCPTDPASRNSSWHGTHVAGTIAAVTNNGIGVAGVAYKAKILPVRVLGRCGGSVSDIADAIIWSAGGAVNGVPANDHPAQVLNLSLGGGGACGSTFQDAIDTARSLGATIIVAAGNDNEDAADSSPANCTGVVTVAAVDREGNRAVYSNYGNSVDVAAPGGETNIAGNGVLSTLNSGTQEPGNESYAFYQGTSMATPHVAGIAALLYAVDPDITPDEVESTLVNNTRPFPGSCSLCGSGIVDASAAINAASVGVTPNDNSLENGVARVDLSASVEEELLFTLEVPANASNLQFRTTGSNGDADLYVKFGSSPTTQDNDCKSTSSTSNEICSIANTQAGTYYVVVRAYRNFSELRLTGSFDIAPLNSDDGLLENGVSRPNLSANAEEELLFTLEVPSNASNLRFQTTGNNGDADLYVKFGSSPTIQDSDCKSDSSTSNEICSISNVQAGTYYVLVHAYSSFNGLSLTASYSENFSEGDLYGSEGSFVNYTLQIGTGKSSLAVQLSGGAGDSDLYLRHGNAPTLSISDCNSRNPRNYEVCTIANPESGTWYLGIYGYSDYSGVDLDVQVNP